MSITTGKLHKLIMDEVKDLSELLKNELERGSDRVKIRSENHLFLKLLLEQPELDPKSYRQILNEKYNVVISVDPVRQLKESNLYMPARRTRIERIMKDISMRTYYLIMGISSNPFEDFDNLAKIIRHRAFRERNVEGKIYLISLVNLAGWKKTPIEEPIAEMVKVLELIAQEGSYKLCEEAARRIVNILGVEYGFDKRRTSTERVRDVLEDVELMRDFDDMRDTLLIVQREFSHLQKEFEQQVQNRNREFIREFFTRMNSVRYSQMLDSIAQTDALLDDLQKQGWKMDTNLQAIPTIIQLFINFLRGYGVTPIERLGDVYDLKVSKLSDYEFIGSSPLQPDDLVQVVVKTPGWKWSNEVISKPIIEQKALIKANSKLD